MKNAAKTAVVTGATSGIGLGIAEAFLAQGYNVVGTGRSRARLQDAAKQLNAGGRFLGVAGDVGKPKAAQTTFERALAAFGQVDVLVNNAGIFQAKPFWEFTPEEIEQQIATNLKGVLFASQQAARHMISRKRGKIINITASIGMQPINGLPAVLATALKGGVNQATRAMALELAPYGVTVNAVAPGVIDTPMHPDRRMYSALAKLHPLGRVGTVGEVADAVLYLARADFVTGIVLPVDGGTAAGK